MIQPSHAALFCLYLGMMSRVSQMPVVLIPIHFDRKQEERPHIPSCQYSIVLRPFITSDFMTGVPAIPGVDIPESVSVSMVNSIHLGNFGLMNNFHWLGPVMKIEQCENVSLTFYQNIFGF